MSFKASNAVWDADIRPAAKKLALLALADYFDDNGGRLFPSHQTVAHRVGVEPRQVRRFFAEFIKLGLLTIEVKGAGPGRGGGRGRAPRYRLHIDRIGQLQRISHGSELEALQDRHFGIDDQAASVPSEEMAVPQGTKHRSPRTETPVPQSRLTIREPEENHQGAAALRAAAHRIFAAQGPVGARPAELTHSEWTRRAESAGRPAQPTDAQFDEIASGAGLSNEYARAAWVFFVETYAGDQPDGRQKKYRDWIGMFKHMVSKDIFEHRRRDGQLNTSGLQAIAAYRGATANADAQREPVCEMADADTEARRAAEVVSRPDSVRSLPSVEYTKI